MIQNKYDLCEYMKQDMAFYYANSKREQLIEWILNDPIYYIAKYIRLLRKEEYYFNTSTNKWETFLYLFYLRRKNSLGNKLGFKIPKNCFGPGLTIYHHGEIIINENVKVGANCKLHGGNCIGNNGINNDVPMIGDSLDLGIGAKIIGNVTLGNNIRVGANAVVTKSFTEGDVILIGCPAHIKKQ